MIHKIEERTESLNKQDSVKNSVYRKIRRQGKVCKKTLKQLMNQYPHCIKQNGSDFVALSREEGLELFYKSIREKVMNQERMKAKRNCINKPFKKSSFSSADFRTVKEQLLKYYYSKAHRKIGTTTTSESEPSPFKIRREEPLRQTYVVSKVTLTEQSPPNCNREESVIVDVKDEKARIGQRRLSPRKSVSPKKSVSSSGLPHLPTKTSLTAPMGTAPIRKTAYVAKREAHENLATDDMKLEERPSSPRKGTELPPIASTSGRSSNKQTVADRMMITSLEKSQNDRTGNGIAEAQHHRPPHNIQITFDSVKDETKRPLNLPPIVRRSKSRHHHGATDK